jgi:hypothetical protein
MADKHLKKVKQLARREIRGEVEQVVKQFREDLVGNPPINTKPNWVPKFIWKFMVTSVIKKSFFEKWYGVKF